MGVFREALRQRAVKAQTEAEAAAEDVAQLEAEVAEKAELAERLRRTAKAYMGALRVEVIADGTDWMTWADEHLEGL